MTRYDYKTVAAPRRERKTKGVRPGADAFALTLQAVLNEESAAGWEFLRAESLPCDERAGWFGGRREVLHSVLVFRRAVPLPEAAPAPSPRRAEPAATPRAKPVSLFEAPL
ncbi:MAG: hypothetical protein ACJA1L_000249 [Paracoccaceae bacterium]|jgi:hypothetical protein